MTQAEELQWLRSWRERCLSAQRLWFNAESYRQGCERLTDLRAVLNEKHESWRRLHVLSGAVRDYRRHRRPDPNRRLG